MYKAVSLLLALSLLVLATRGAAVLEGGAARTLGCVDCKKKPYRPPPKKYRHIRRRPKSPPPKKVKPPPKKSPSPSVVLPSSPSPSITTPFVPPGALVTHGESLAAFAVEQCANGQGFFKIGNNPPVQDCACCPNTVEGQSAGGCGSDAVSSTAETLLAGCATCNDFLLCDACRPGFVKAATATTLTDINGNTVRVTPCVPI